MKKVEGEMRSFPSRETGEDWNTEIKPKIKKLMNNSRGQRFGEVRLNVPMW